MAKKQTLREQIEERDALLLKALETNEAFAKQNQEIRVAANNAAAKAKELGESVALFKQEALQSAVREAELRGYIQRTLEDDAVREPAPVKSELTDDQRQHMIERLGRDDRARNQPAPRRTGPSSMGYSPIMGTTGNCTSIADAWESQHRASWQTTNPEPKHWLNR